MTILYDQSWPGLLSAIFETYRLKLADRVSIVAENEYQDQLFGQPLRVDTNPERAARIIRALNSKRKGLSKLLWRGFLSEDAQRERILLHTIRRIFKSGPDVVDDLTDDLIHRLRRLDKQMGREIHRMHAFVRFQQTPDDLYVSLIEPDFDVLPLAHQHFVDRYAIQDWLIYDFKRKYGIHWDKEQQKVSYVCLENNSDEGQRGPARQLSKDVLATGETQYQELWRTYFHAVDIPERRNLKLHRQHVPRRYWKYLIEKQV
ncbi:MAG: TIGR03915 family putative DNA repair protein [Bacteroidota bacterium]